MTVPYKIASIGFKLYMKLNLQYIDSIFVECDAICGLNDIVN